MTKEEIIAKVVSRAEALVGLNEADGSYLSVLDSYNAISPLPRGYRMGPGDAWCAAFVSAVGADCGVSGVLLPECSCIVMRDLYRAVDRFEDASLGVPHVGDVILYDFDGGGPDHVGIITGINGDELRVVEGNCSDAVSVRHLNASSRIIYGFCTPDYASLADEEESYRPAPQMQEPEPPTEEPEISRGCTLVLPRVCRGDCGSTVQAMQAILIARGYRCGPWGTDGEYGDATYGGLTRFQRARGLKADGVAGEETWRALLGVSA